jgi:hypothetical protein
VQRANFQLSACFWIWSARFIRSITLRLVQRQAAPSLPTVPDERTAGPASEPAIAKGRPEAAALLVCCATAVPASHERRFAVRSVANLRGTQGIEAQIDDEARDAFRREAERIFEADLRGPYCRIGWCDDADEVNVVVTHGAPLKTTEVIEAGADRVISFREAEHAVLSYSAVTGSAGSRKHAVRSSRKSSPPPC